MIDFNRRELRKQLLSEADAASNSQDRSLLGQLADRARGAHLLEVEKEIRAREASLDGNLELALQLTEAALALDPGFPAAHSQKAQLLLRQRAFPEALAAADTSIRDLLLLNHAVFYLHKGDAYSGLGQFDEARFAYLKAVEDEAGFVWAYLKLLDLARTKQDWEEVIQVSQRTREKGADQAWALSYVGSKLLQDANTASRLGRQDLDARLSLEAQAALEGALAKGPATATYYYNLACSFGRQGDAANAVTFLGKAIEAERDRGTAPRYVDMAKTDVDFSRVRDNAKFRELIGGEVPSAQPG